MEGRQPTLKSRMRYWHGLRGAGSKTSMYQGPAFRHQTRAIEVAIVHSVMEVVVVRLS